MKDHIELLAGLGAELGELVKLCRDMDEVFFDKIEQLSRTDAQALLVTAVLVLAEGRTL